MKVSCIIPAYNEETRVSKVIEAVKGHHLIDEIIVVNDGSTDNTKEVLEKENGIHLISYEKNRGKSSAVMLGLQQARNEIVMLVDADLIGVDHQNISALIQPVLEGKVDLTMTMRKNSLGIYKLLGIDFVSGERVFHKKMIKDLEAVGRLTGYGLEVFLNSIVINDRLRVKVVYWDNVSITMKTEKIGKWKGFIGEINMIRQIASTVGLFPMIYQLFQMRQRIVKST